MRGPSRPRVVRRVCAWRVVALWFSASGTENGGLPKQMPAENTGPIPGRTIGGYGPKRSPKSRGATGLRME